MPSFGLVGPGYASQSLLADCQRTVNRILEAIESGEGQSKAALYPSPGTKTFYTYPEPSVRGEQTINGRYFAVAGTGFYEGFADGTFIKRGTVQFDTVPAGIAVSEIQVFLTSGGKAYCFTLATNAFVEILTDGTTQLQGPVSFCGYSDGVFVALLKNTNEFQISGILDGTSWDPTDIGKVSEFPDNVISLIVDHREVWLFGLKATVHYYNSGNPLFPYEPIPGAYIEQGISAPYTPAKLDNSIFWIGGDERGQGIAWRAQGYVPVRVSNHAVENEWRSYATITDARSYTYQDGGHAFWVIYFPTANKTWVYDVATGSWSERGFLDIVTGRVNAHHSQCHALAFGRHLVGDWNSGKVYDMSVNYLDDDGQPLMWSRRAPHVSKEQEWAYHHKLQIFVEPGIANQPPLLDGAGNPRGPQLFVRWSDDGAKTWSNPRTYSYGQAGKYRERIMVNKLGRARDRVYEVYGSDPVPVRIIDAFLDVSQ